MRKILFLAFALLASQALGKHFISGANRVTFRAGPGTENKIIRMLDADTEVALVSKGEEWSRARLKDGKEGFVMTRFLSKEVPYSIRYERLSARHKKLQEELARLKEGQAKLNENLGQAKRELASTKEDLDSASSQYEELKNGAANYIQLKEKYDQASAELSALSQEKAMLQEKLSLYYFTWFLAGAGVLLFGWILGFFSKKRKSGYGGGIRL